MSGASSRDDHLDTHDPRSLKALAIAAEAGQWAKVRTKDGRKAYAVPSQRDPSVRYLADLNGCTCPDFQRRELPCKHVLGVRIHCALVHAMGQPAKRESAERLWARFEGE